MNAENYQNVAKSPNDPSSPTPPTETPRLEPRADGGVGCSAARAETAAPTQSAKISPRGEHPSMRRAVTGGQKTSQQDTQQSQGEARAVSATQPAPDKSPQINPPNDPSSPTAHAETPPLKQEDDGAVRCSAWLGRWFHYGIRPKLVWLGRRIWRGMTLWYPCDYPKPLRFFTPSDKYSTRNLIELQKAQPQRFFRGCLLP